MDFRSLAAPLAFALVCGFGPSARAQCFEQKIWPPNFAEAERFGFDVDVEDGVLVVGDLLAGASGSGPGAAYVYGWDDSAQAWSLVAELVPTVLPGHNSFGRQVATDGDRIAVAAGSLGGPGRVHVFAHDGAAWFEEAVFEGAFGASLDEGRLALVYNSHLLQPNNARLTVHEIAGGSYPVTFTFDFFPWTGVFELPVVRLEGEWIVVSNPLAPCFLVGGNCGQYFFFRENGGSWAFDGVVDGTSANPLVSAALDIEGDRFVAGTGYPAYGASVHRFDGAAWVLEQKLEKPVGLEWFGADVDLEFPWIAVGAPYSPLAGQKSGAVVLYEWNGSAWVRRHVLGVGLADGTDLLGYSVAIEEGVVFAGASQEEFHQEPVGAVHVRRFDDGQALLACPGAVSVADGGGQKLFLHAPAPHAGSIYWVLGSASGTTPGVLVDGVSVPLAPDSYTLAMLATPNQGPFEKTLGLLGPDGYAGPNIVVPARSDPSLVGMTLHHAFLAIDPTLGSVEYASNATTLTLLP